MSQRENPTGHNEQKRVVIVGPGRVGSFWARAALSKGIEIALYARDPGRAPGDLRPIVRPFNEHLPPGSWSQMDLVLLTCGDAEIPDVLRQILSPAALHEPDSGPVVAHVSGSVSTEVLLNGGVPAARAVSTHPLYPFKSRDSSPPPEQVFHAVEGPPSASERVGKIIQATGGRFFCLNGVNKSLYHLACVVASNHVVTLYHVAQTLLGSATGSNDVPSEALRSLMKASVENLRNEDPARALSGPAQRGDATAISHHLETLEKLAPEYRALYCELLTAAQPLLPPDSQEKLAPLLEEPDS